MNHNQNSTRPYLEAMPRLGVFEERTVPAQLSVHGNSDVDHGHQAQEDDAWSSVATLAVQADDLRSWLSEDSLYIDSPSHANDNSGSGKKAESPELGSFGTLATLEMMLTSSISNYTKSKGRTQNEKSDKPDAVTPPDKIVQPPVRQRTEKGGKQESPESPATPPVTTPVNEEPVADDSGSGDPIAVPADKPASDKDKIEPESSVSNPPAKEHTVEHAHPTPSGETTYSLIIAPVLTGTNGAVANANGAAYAAQAGEHGQADAQI